MIVGAVATFIDFGVLFGLHALGLQSIVANVISTFMAFCFSFFANKHYTFQTAGKEVHREIVLFVIVTLFGVWVLQSLVIISITPVLDHILSGSLLLLVAKFAATGVSLVWNFILYPRVVFKTKPVQ